MNITSLNNMPNIQPQKSKGASAILNIFWTSLGFISILHKQRLLLKVTNHINRYSLYVYVIAREKFQEIIHYKDYNNPRQSSFFSEQIIADSYSIENGNLYELR